MDLNVRDTVIFFGVVGVALSIAKGISGPPHFRDRLAVIPEAVSGLDNAFYDNHDWDTPEHPLLKLNAARLPYFAQKLERHLATDQPAKILDVGCGGGILTEALARHKSPSWHFTGVDISAQSIDAAKKHASKEDVANVDYRVSSAFTLPFEDASFDAVISSDVIEHIHDLRKYASEVTRVLRPGGIFVFDTINRTWQAHLFAIVLAQQILRIIPPNAHSSAMFVKPDEIRYLLGSHQLDVAPESERVGMYPTLRPGRFLETLYGSMRKRGVQQTAVAYYNGDISPVLIGPFKQTESYKEESYAWYAVKRA
ncbi:hypothetical protein E5Q_04919 [Mixia osmundae IAM 14324]|uniref:Methyltransferase type 11 domain-containing protein n=2 Tax=Mixia osmundae (strain CBS 9802 / IAM 14324 / JCM 22182 / KY 12970) TaxID=764103 RepID=G7E5X6_MIXOS|nr:hypothetical protein E5Q_04919 [Mixia osmundae IAM 14324]